MKARWTSLLLFALFLVFSTPTPMNATEAAGNPTQATIHGAEFHTHIKSRTPSHFVSKTMPLQLLALLCVLLAIPAGLPFTVPPLLLAYLSSISLFLRQRMLRPLKFTSTYVSAHDFQRKLFVIPSSSFKF